MGEHRVRVSFDLDDTLVCYHAGALLDAPAPWYWRWWFGEPLRRGTRQLLRELVDRGCEVWVYTTSDRRPWYVTLWFRMLGMRVHGVVNQAAHRHALRSLSFCSYPPTKYPPAFGIHLHVDDSEGVAVEGQRHGFAVLVVAPDDPDWTRRVLDAVDRLTARPVPPPRAGTAPRG